MRMVSILGNICDHRFPLRALGSISHRANKAATETCCFVYLPQTQFLELLASQTKPFVEGAETFLKQP
jgi:hypothetical protein